MTPNTSFVDELSQRLKEMDRRAKAVGSNMNRVCKATGIARVTYERWINRAPQTFHKIDEMEAEISRLEQERAKSQNPAK